MRAELSQLGRFDRLTPEDGNREAVKPGHPRNAFHRTCVRCRQFKGTAGGQIRPVFICATCKGKA